MLVQGERSGEGLGTWTGEQYFVPAESLLAELTITARRWQPPWSGMATEPSVPK
jgi:hypothetical protein